MGRADARRARQGSARRAKPTSRKASRSRKSKTKKTGIRRFFTWKKLVGAFFAVCLLGILGFIGLYLYVDVPKANAQAEAQSNTYRYSDGSIMVRRGEVNRENVPLSKIPKPVQDAFVAAENKTFYDDSGVDLKGTARGILNTVMGKGKQGGSTITQQWVKNYFLSQEQTVSRKLQEIIISLKVDNKYSKQDILAGYINTSFYGRNAYGIQAAAQAYYGVDADKLNVSQGAYLASLLQAPSQYDWAVASAAGKKRVQERWAYALDNMVEMKWLTAQERAKQKFPVPIKPKPAPGLEGQVGYFVEAAKNELIKQGVDEKELAAGGWTINLGIDEKKQKALEAAAKEGFTDLLKPDSRKVDKDAQLGAASVDPKTGHIVAMYGGQGYTKHYTNNALRQDYQPASTFKPVVLASAFKNKSVTQDKQPITPDTIYNGTNKRPVKGPGGGGYAPENEDQYSPPGDGSISVQKATNKSVNTVFAQMIVDVGMDKVKDTAVSLGMSDKIVPRPAMALGSMGASPLQMAGVYATFDAHGKKVTPTLVTSAERNGEVKYKPKDPVGDEVIDAKTADTVTSVLKGVVDDGTGAVAKNTDYDVVGKTGTSDNNKSAWFVGYTPTLVTAVGMFGEAPETAGKVRQGDQVPLYGVGGEERVNGGGFPAKVWKAYTEEALGGAANERFDLDTDLGAGVPPPHIPAQTPSRTPSQTPSRTPSQTPSQTPSRTPTQTPPTKTPPTQTPPTHTPPTNTPTNTPSPPSPPASGGQTGGDDSDGLPDLN